MNRGLNIFVNIGAKLLPTINSTATAVERRFGTMARRLKVQAAETKAAWRGMSAAASPMLGLMAAGGLTMGLKGIFSEGSEYQHQLQMLRNAGRSFKEVSQAQAVANRTIRELPTTTLIDNLKVLNETTGAFGSFQHALDNLTFNQKVGSMMTSVMGEGEPGERFNAIVRSLEMRGAALDSRRYQRETGELYKSIVFTGGRVNPDEFLNYSQQANPYTKGLSERYLYRIAPSLIQEFGGDKAGTMQNTFTGTILGKAKNKISTEAWMRLGLLDPKQVVYNKVGPVGWRPGAIKGTNLAMQDPLAWAEQVLIPAMKAKGVNTGDQLSLQKMLMPLFRDRNANRLANALTYNQDRLRLHKDERLINQVPDVDKAYQQALYNDPKMAWAATANSLKNLETVLGRVASPQVATALVHVANGINSLAMIFEKHPNFGKGVVALMGIGAGVATLKVFGIAVGWLLSPLKGLFSLLFKVGPRQIGVVGWLFRGLASGFRLIAPLVARLGPLLFRGLFALGPWIIRGVAMAFGLLSNPVGWALIAIAVIALVWKFRHEIAAAWTNIVVPWFKGAWVAVKNYAMSIDWKGLGWKIADLLTFGLATKFRDAMNKMPRSAAAAAGNVGMNSKGGGLAGMRGSGGRVQRNRTYLVGERGEELFTPGSSGSITPNHRLRGGGGALHVGAINIYGATDPQAVAREVRNELNRIAFAGAAYLSD